MLFGLADGAKFKAKYKITSSEKNRHLTKDEKIDVVKRYKKHIDSLKSKVKNTESFHDMLVKTSEGAKELQAWNSYNPEYNTTKYRNYMLWDGEDCDGNLNLQVTKFLSYCYVATGKTFDLQTYQSGQLLFNSAGTSVTAAYYTSNDCSGTPARQSNTVDTLPVMKDYCFPENDSYMGSSITSYRSNTMEAWSGEGAVVMTEFIQTSTCFGTPEQTIWVRAGNCFQEGPNESIMFKDGPRTLFYENSASCSGEYYEMDLPTCGEEDDDENDDEEDDDQYNDVDDDAQFDYIILDEEGVSFSTSFSWVGGYNSCEKGMYRMNGMCNLCPAGFYSDGMTSCTMCDEGTYAPHFSSECYDCPPGTFAVNKGSSECHLCPVNTYPNSQKSMCLPCPEGQMAAPGSSLCQPCGGLMV